MEKYVTLVYLPEDEEVANQLADEFAEKNVDVHLFEKHDLKQKEILADIKKTACLIILHISDDFDYRYYLREIVRADNRCQTVAAFLQKSTYQNKYTYNEIEIKEGYPIEALCNDICCIMVGGFDAKVNIFNRGKKRKEAFALYNAGKYVWSLCLLLKVFKMNDVQVKEKIATAYSTLMDSDKAINYYSICLPDGNPGSQAEICNNLGYLYTQTRNLEFAEKYLKLAIENGSPDALYNLGFLYETSWAYDSKMRRTREAFDIYCQVLESKTTSENSKALAKEKLTEQAEKLLLRRNYAVAMTYFKAIGNGAKVAECLRNIKMLREAYEARKRQQAGK